MKSKKNREAWFSNPNADMNMSSLKGYIVASYAELKSVFGPAMNGDDKVSTQWTVQGPGVVLSIYDYKETNTYEDYLPSVRSFRQRPSYDWHIGGFGTVGIRDLAEFLSSKLGRTVEYRTGW